MNSHRLGQVPTGKAYDRRGHRAEPTTVFWTGPISQPKRSKPHTKAPQERPDFRASAPKSRLLKTTWNVSCTLMTYQCAFSDSHALMPIEKHKKAKRSFRHFLLISDPTIVEFHFVYVPGTLERTRMKAIVASLQYELASVETDIATLIKDMEASIAQANAFINAMTQE